MKARYPLTGLVMGALLLVAAAERPRPAAVDDARMLAASSDPANWLVNGGDFAGRHYSSLDQINESNVARLGPAWSFDFDTWRGQESEPLVVDGVMYVTTAWSKVYALDAATGKQLWFYDSQVPKERGVNACCDVVNRGAAVYKGKVYLGTVDGRLIALDARTGKPVWSVQTTPPDRLYSITGAPRVIKDKVIIGNGGGEFDARGFVTAYDAATGKKVWRFYIVPGDPAKPDHEVSDETLEKIARPTWFGKTYYDAGGGGTAWNAIHYDPDNDQILIGTGNGTPWNRQYRSEGKGDNLFLCGILALDADTGKYRWHYQENPGDTWDYNATQPMILATLTIDGRPRKVVMHAPKNGFFYVIDRTNGKLISATPIVDNITWASGIDPVTGRPIEKEGARYEKASYAVSPGPGGAHNWHAMAYDPKTGLVYLPVSESSFLFESASYGFVRRGGGVYNDGLEHHKPLTPAATPPSQISVPNKVIAFDPVARRIVWTVEGQGGGLLATAGGLVFQGRGNLTGDLAAFRATDGKLLWSYALPNGVVANPITYKIGDTQYVAVATGMGGSRFVFAAEGGRQPQVGRMVVFKLGGKAPLPAGPLPPPPFVTDTRLLSPENIRTGQLRYTEVCWRCHGVPSRSSNIVPDLRRSQIHLDAAAWRSVVIDGALAHNGMVGWKTVITPAEAEAIRDYVESEARAAAGATAPVKPSMVGAPQ